MEFNEATKAQIVRVQMMVIMEFCANIIDKGFVFGDEADKIQRMFKIVNEK